MDGLKYNDTSRTEDFLDFIAFQYLGGLRIIQNHVSQYSRSTFPFIHTNGYNEIIKFHLEITRIISLLPIQELLFLKLSSSVKTVHNQHNIFLDISHTFAKVNDIVAFPYISQVL